MAWGNRVSVTPAILAPFLVIASGSIHAVVNASVKGGKDKMAASAAMHAHYLHALIRA
ncbi:MAG: hypothetical protein V4459_06705 [Pseudomonadota bacterium]